MVVNKAVSIFGLFVCLAPQGSGSPLMDRCMTTEKVGEKRRGKGLLFRLPFTGNRPTIGLVLGKWRKT